MLRAQQIQALSHGCSGRACAAQTFMRAKGQLNAGSGEVLHFLLTPPELEDLRSSRAAPMDGVQVSGGQQMQHGWSRFYLAEEFMLPLERLWVVLVSQERKKIKPPPRKPICTGFNSLFPQETQRRRSGPCASAKTSNPGLKQEDAGAPGWGSPLAPCSRLGSPLEHRPPGLGALFSAKVLSTSGSPLQSCHFPGC